MSLIAPNGDPTRIVADSVRQGKPIIVVSMNYRVNVFAFGDNTPSSDVNLALEDQKLAIAWVRKHIRGFGGDEDNITLAGESAGAVYAHALMVLGTPVRRGILMSGSLFLSPPLPRERGQGLIDRFASVAKESGKAVSLQDAKVETLLDCVKKCKAVSMWLQMTDEFKGWSERMENVETLMVGDVEYESVIWRNGIETMTASEIDAAFSLVQNKDHREQLRNAYCIDVDHTTASKLGALDFINDTRFAMPSQDIAEKWRTAGRPVYQYIVDQANPWQASARSHHALDLVLLFGGYDISFNHHAEEVGKAMRSDWIEFINGTEPWDPKARMAFGPAGKSEQLQDIKHYASRRRMKQWDVLKRIDAGDVVKVFGALAAGKISFSN
ncbi:MAG: hypothetical protein M4579_001993 [Chaenotheca gracillima]|nr:MAG: hypothetical protein M4579_001993 [Chaenotheca gracillima]